MLIQNGTMPTLVFLLVQKDDPTLPATDMQPAVQISKNGGSFTPPSGSVSQMGNGWYSLQLTAAETDVDGPLVVIASDEGTLEWRDIHQVYSDVVAVLDDAVYDRVADHILRRNFAAASASGNGDAKDFRSLLGAVAKDVNRVQLNGASLEIYEADDQTLLGTQTVVTNTATTPVTELNTD